MTVAKTRSGKKFKQLEMFKKEKSSYGGVLRNTRQGRVGPRKLSTRFTMHIVLKSSKAIDEWSFSKPKTKARIRAITGARPVPPVRADDIGL